MFVLGGIAIGGIFYTPEADYVQMEPDSTAMLKSEDKSHEITLLYGTSNNLRALSWREVLGESLDKSHAAPIHMMNEEHSGEGQQNLNNKDDSSKLKQGKRRHSQKKCQDSGSSAETVTTNIISRKQFMLMALYMAPQWAVILSSGTESTVVMEGDSWHGVKVINVDENGVTLDEGGNVRCVSIGES